MPAITDHPAFLQPADRTAKIWRYIDLARLVALLSSRSLYFPRLDQLDDPFEGSLSKAEFDHWKEVAEAGERDGTLPAHWKGRYLDILLGNSRRARKAVYVNCWHLSDSESEAMWRLYSPSGQGVAVQSSYETLANVLPAKIYNGCYLGLVRYTDHHREQMPGGNIFNAVTHKRRAFEHEKEVRAVIWFGDRGPDVDRDQVDNPLGLSVPLEPHALIESIFVSPAAPR